MWKLNYGSWLYNIIYKWPFFLSRPHPTQDTANLCVCFFRFLTGIGTAIFLSAFAIFSIFAFIEYFHLNPPFVSNIKWFWFDFFFGIVYAGWLIVAVAFFLGIILFIILWFPDNYIRKMNIPTPKPLRMAGDVYKSIKDRYCILIKIERPKK